MFTKSTSHKIDLKVAAGRIPNVEGLGLEAAGVEYSPAGVKVKDDLRTSNPDILAIGDVPWGKEEDEKTPTKLGMSGFCMTKTRQEVVVAVAVICCWWWWW